MNDLGGRKTDEHERQRHGGGGDRHAAGPHRPAPEENLHGGGTGTEPPQEQAAGRQANAAVVSGDAAPTVHVSGKRDDWNSGRCLIRPIRFSRHRKVVKMSLKITGLCTEIVSFRICV